MGGMILVSTVPSLVENALEKPLVPLPKDRVQNTAILSLVGEEERGNQAWTQVSERWLAGGVPLTLAVVRGKGEGWLMGEPQTRLLDQWLGVLPH